MKFDWRKFTEDDYNKYMEKRNEKIYDAQDYIGSVYVGDISIDLIDCGEDNLLNYDFYVAHEDTGYGYKGAEFPYDYAEGDGMEVPYGLSYEEFKSKAEKLFEDYIIKHDKWRVWDFDHKEYLEYSLVEHANRPLEIW